MAFDVSRIGEITSDENKSSGFDVSRLNEENNSTISQGFTATYQDEEGSIYDEDLINDKDFVEASRIMYKMNTGKDFKGDNNKLAEYGIDFMGWFNYNLPMMTLNAARISNAEDNQQRAMLYMMESYDDLGLSLAGTVRVIKGLAGDPTTYLGLTTFGFGAAAGQAGKIATKTGVMELLKQSVKGGFIASTEAGVYMAVDDINRQVVETSVSGEDIDLGRTAKMGAIGATVGFGLGTGVTAIGKKLSQKSASKKVTEEVTEEIIDEADSTLTINTIDKTTPAGKIDDSVDKLIKKVKEVMPEGKPAAVSKEASKTIKVGKGLSKKDITVEGKHRQNLKELQNIVKPITQILKSTAAKNPNDIADILSKSELTVSQAQGLHTSVAQASDEIGKIVNVMLRDEANATDPAIQTAIREQVDELIETTLVPLHKTLDVFNSDAGRRLRALQEFDVRSADLMLEGNSIQKIQDEYGIDRVKAINLYQKKLSEAKNLTKQKREIADLDLKIKQEYQKGNVSDAILFKTKRDNLNEILIQKELSKEGIFKNAYRMFNKPIKVLSEIAIGAVFSPPTVIINTVPSLLKALYKPVFNNLLRGDLNSNTFKAMGREYSSMISMVGSAKNAALAAMKYERSLLTGDSARFLENFNTIPKKYGGGFVRFFPRLLLGTDAFFETIHYRGYIVGNAAASALEDANKQGVKNVKEFVDKRVNQAIENAYKPQENVFDILYQDGISRGITDPAKLERFVKREAEKNAKQFTEATSTSGRNYVQDVLFKRDFSGQGSASKLAKAYEVWINKNPAMRLMGQLFFRTPVRVFEEGFRLTAGLNLISPNFFNDLSGKNGQVRQIRAQGEAMLSYAIAGSVFAMYSTGSVTGAKESNYKLRRQGENAGELEPYSFYFSDGSSFNYRNFDPFSTPVKIIVNALERAEVLAYRAEQGERINDTAYEEIQAYVSVAVGSIAQSIRDANLMQGVDSAVKFIEDLEDEDGSGQIIKFFGQKVQTFLPNTYYKIQIQNDPILGDPATLEQFIRYRINPSDKLVPKQYTALGRERTLSNPAASMYYFDLVTKEERKRGVPEYELKVEQWLYKIGQATDTHFTAPYKVKYLKGRDLRLKNTKDGQDTYYGRWQKYYKDLDPAQYLESLIDLPMGTPREKGVAVTEAKKIINRLREMAFQQLMSEEEDIISNYEETMEDSFLSKFGEKDVLNVPNATINKLKDYK